MKYYFVSHNSFWMTPDTVSILEVTNDAKMVRLCIPHNVYQEPVRFN